MSKLAREQLQEIHSARVWLRVFVQIDNHDRDMLVCSGNVIGTPDLAVVKVLASELTEYTGTTLHDRDDVWPMVSRWFLLQHNEGKY